MGENLNMADNKEFDLTQEMDAERFAFDCRKYVIGKEITGLIVRPDRVEVHLDGGRFMVFAVKGQDIVVHIPVASVQRLDANTLDRDTGGRIN